MVEHRVIPELIHSKKGDNFDAFLFDPDHCSESLISFDLQISSFFYVELIFFYCGCVINSLTRTQISKIDRK